MWAHFCIAKFEYCYVLARRLFARLSVAMAFALCASEACVVGWCGTWVASSGIGKPMAIMAKNRTFAPGEDTQGLIRRPCGTVRTDSQEIESRVS